MISVARKRILRLTERRRTLAGCHLFFARLLALLTRQERALGPQDEQHRSARISRGQRLRPFRENIAETEVEWRAIVRQPRRFRSISTLVISGSQAYQAWMA